MKKGLTLLLSLVLVLAMSVTAFAAEDWVTPVQNIEKWDEEVDFLVVGYGLAGAAAAVEAYDIDPDRQDPRARKDAGDAGGRQLHRFRPDVPGSGGERGGNRQDLPGYTATSPTRSPMSTSTWLCDGLCDPAPVDRVRRGRR